MTEQPEKKYREEDEFFEGERDEQQNNQSEPESEWLRKRREWLRLLLQEDRDFIAKYGLEIWEKSTGKKRDE